jgi:hypothetical protein
MLSVVLVNVVMLSVLVPFGNGHCHYDECL